MNEALTQSSDRLDEIIAEYLAANFEEWMAQATMDRQADAADATE